MHTHGDSNTRVHLYHEMLIRESANISLNIATVAQQRQTDTTETETGRGEQQHISWLICRSTLIPFK